MSGNLTDEDTAEVLDAAFRAAAEALRIALAFQTGSLQVLMSKLVDAKAITHDDASDVNTQIAAAMEAHEFAGTTLAPFNDVLLESAKGLRNNAAIAAFGGANVEGGKQ